MGEALDVLAAAITSWEAMTEAGGEGVVVKPADSVIQSKKGLIQPALKVRAENICGLSRGPTMTHSAILKASSSAAWAASAAWLSVSSPLATKL